MPKVHIVALSSVREKTGWSVREVDFEGGTVADVLKLVETSDGGTLFDLLVDGEQIRRGYVVLLNGETSASPGKRLQDGDKVVAMEVLRIMAGGQDTRTRFRNPANRRRPVLRGREPHE